MKHYTVYNRSADSVILKANGESYILLPYSNQVLSLNTVEHRKASADTRLVIKAK